MREGRRCEKNQNLISPFYSISQIPKTTDGPGPSTQTLIPASLQSASKYKKDSKEQQTKEEAIAQWIGRTGLPVRTIEDEDFVSMIDTLDKRLAVPKKTKISNLIDKQYDNQRQNLKRQLDGARRVSIGLDMWTKKGLTASFLAISASFFCVEKNKPEHILLTLEQVAHPHNAQTIKGFVDICMQEWGIPKEKILTVITDNGSNMVAAFKPTTAEGEETSSSEEDSPGPTMGSDSESEVDDLR